MRATSGNEASTPTAPVSSAPTAKRPAADVELVRRRPQRPPRPGPAAVRFAQLVADLLGHPVLGPDHDRAERRRSARRPPPGNTWRR